MKMPLMIRLAPEVDPETETDALTDEDRDTMLDHVAEFVEFMLDSYPICPTCLPELVAGYVDDVVMPETALTDDQNAPTSMALH